jgi:hypothetical protein
MLSDNNNSKSIVDHPVLFSGSNRAVLDDDECTFRISNQSESYSHSSSAKKTSGLRFKFMLEGTRRELMNLQRRNEQLRAIVREYIRPLDVAEEILRNAQAPIHDIFLPSSILLDDEMELRDIKSSTTATTTTTTNITAVPLPSVQTDGKSIHISSSHDMLQSDVTIPQSQTSEIPEQINVKTASHSQQDSYIQRPKRMNEIKVDSSVYESGQIESLAAALNGDIAF